MAKNKYAEIKNVLLESITSDAYPIGSQLPPELELAKTYHVSRGTIRRAIKELAEEAIVSRRSGKGTVVIRKPTKDRPILSITSLIQQRGKTPSTQVISEGAVLTQEAEPWVQSALHLITDSQSYLYRLERIRYADAMPVSWQTSYLLSSNLKSEFFKGPFTGSLFERFQDFGYQVSWADEIIQARLATPLEIDRLKMQDLNADQRIIWLRKRISYNQANIPLEVVISRDRGDFFSVYHYRIQEEYGYKPEG